MFSLVKDGCNSNPVRWTGRHRAIVRCLCLPLVTVALAGTIAWGPRQAPTSPQPRGKTSRRLQEWRNLAFLHSWSLLGSYRGFDAAIILSQISRLDRRACRWVLNADAEELRSVLFPRPVGERPGDMRYVNVISPEHGG